MNKTERIKIRALQGATVAEMIAEFGVTKQRISAAIHYTHKYGKRGAKVKPDVCRTCGVSLTGVNRVKYHRQCRPCINTYVKNKKGAKTMKIIIRTEINPTPGHIYHTTHGHQCYQCSDVDPATRTITVIPESTSTPRRLTYEQFSQMFGNQKGE